MDSYQRLTPDPDSGVHSPWQHSTRARLFAFIFVFTFALGAVLTLLQPTIYRSSATVLMSAPSAIDADIEEANIQSVAIQRRILLGSEVTDHLLSEAVGSELHGIDITYLREVLRVIPVADTNLVEMVAQGSDGHLLPSLVDTWIDVYLDIRASNVEQSQQQTLQVVQDQLDELAAKLEQARSALADYREEHDITSAERQENEELARLEGLNAALNKAIEADISARANLETLRRSIAQGKNIVPPSDRISVQNMMTEQRQLKSQLANLSKNYTMDYIRKQPKWRDIPDRIEELETQLDEVLEEGQEQVVAQAEQEHAAAQQTVTQLQQEYELQERKAADFTTIYATHQALAEDLAKLEDLNRETQSRLIQVEVNQVEKYPQVSVIDRPAADSERIGPNYLIWLGSSLAAALGLGVLSVWLYGFLGHREKPAYVTLSGVHMYPQDVAGHLAHSAEGEPRLAPAQTRLLQSDDEQTEGDAESDQSHN